MISYVLFRFIYFSLLATHSREICLSCHASSPDLLCRQKWSPSIPRTGGQCSPSGQSHPQDAPHGRPCIVWDKDGNPYLPGIARGKSLLLLEAATVEQFLSSLPKTESVHPYPPGVRPFRPWESNIVHPERPGSAARILIRQTTATMQTAPIWMWHMAKQTSQMTVPTSGGGRIYPRRSRLWIHQLETSPTTPGTRDLSIGAFTHGVASFQQPHCADAPLSFAIRSKLILSTSFNYWLDCAPKKQDTLATLFFLSLLGPVYIGIANSWWDVSSHKRLQTLNGVGRYWVKGNVGPQCPSVLLLWSETSLSGLIIYMLRRGRVYPQSSGRCGNLSFIVIVVTDWTVYNQKKGLSSKIKI